MERRIATKTDVLVVEDDQRYRMLIVDSLETQTYRAFEAACGRDALDMVSRLKFGAILLDVMLPDMSGFDLCPRLRDFSEAPIMMITGRNSDLDKVRGLDIGADDYITKPFSITEMLARLRALLRRSSGRIPTEECLEFGDLLINNMERRVSLGAREVPLTPTEFRLLWYFATNAGRVLVPHVIAENVWNAPDGNVGGTLKTSITRLREKLGDDPAEPRFIHTRRGVGYVFAPNLGSSDKETPS